MHRCTITFQNSGFWENRLQSIPSLFLEDETKVAWIPFLYMHAISFCQAKQIFASLRLTTLMPPGNHGNLKKLWDNCEK